MARSPSWKLELHKIGLYTHTHTVTHYYYTYSIYFATMLCCCKIWCINCNQWRTTSMINIYDVDSHFKATTSTLKYGKCSMYMYTYVLDDAYPCIDAMWFISSSDQSCNMWKPTEAHSSSDSLYAAVLGRPRSEAVSMCHSDQSRCPANDATSVCKLHIGAQSCACTYSHVASVYAILLNSLWG